MAAALSRVYAGLCRRYRLTSKKCPFWFYSLFCALGTMTYKIDFPTHFQSLSFIVSHKIFHLPFIVPIIVVPIITVNNSKTWLIGMEVRGKYKGNSTFRAKALRPGVSRQTSRRRTNFPTKELRSKRRISATFFHRNFLA